MAEIIYNYREFQKSEKMANVTSFYSTYNYISCVNLPPASSIK